MLIEKYRQIFSIFKEWSLFIFQMGELRIPVLWSWISDRDVRSDSRLQLHLQVLLLRQMREVPRNTAQSLLSLSISKSPGDFRRNFVSENFQIFIVSGLSRSMRGSRLIKWIARVNVGLVNIYTHWVRLLDWNNNRVVFGCFISNKLILYKADGFTNQ